MASPKGTPVSFFRSSSAPSSAEAAPDTFGERARGVSTRRSRARKLSDVVRGTRGPWSTAIENKCVVKRDTRLDKGGVEWAFKENIDQSWF